MTLSLNDCTKKFRKTVAVNGCSILFEQGVYGLLGPNGAGKTTLLRCICGFYKLNGGTISGVDQNIGYLPQKFGMFRELSVYQMMEYLSSLKNIQKNRQKQEIERCIELVNLSDSLSARVSSLSGGMLRRVGIAQAFLGDPEVLLFDEPTVGLDPEERTRFKNAISSRRHKGIVIISTHIVNDVEALCNQIVIMNNGELVAKGTNQEISRLAEGKVYLVPGNRESQLSGDFFISDRMEKNDTILLRVLSSQAQPGEMIQPDTEDGYLCSIKGF